MTTAHKNCWCQEGRWAASECPIHGTDGTSEEAQAAAKIRREEYKAELISQQARMQELFNLLCDDLDWRAPVKVTISAPLYFKLLKAFKTTFEELAQAVEYMTATPLSITLQGEIYHLTAPGYRAGPAGP